MLINRNAHQNGDKKESVLMFVILCTVQTFAHYFLIIKVEEHLNMEVKRIVINVNTSWLFFVRVILIKLQHLSHDILTKFE